MSMPRWILPVIILLFGCSLGQAQPPTPFPTATTVRMLPTLVPTVNRLASQIATPTTTMSPTVAPLQPTLVPETVVAVCDPLPLTRHEVMAVIDYDAQFIEVQQTITYTNRTAQPLDRLVINVEPNRWLDVFTLNNLNVNGEAVQFALTGRKLDVMLNTSLEPDCRLQLRLDFSLAIPPIIGGMEAFRGYFGHSPRQINLGHWLPTVVPVRDGVWLHNASILIGEQLVLDPAEWFVTITLRNAPEGTLVAAPGTVTELSPTSWQFGHVGREFSASVSPVFRVLEMTASDGTQVESYSMPDALIWDETTTAWIDGGAYVLEVAAESAGQFAEQFGVSPHERLVIVQGDFPDGMEFSGFAFVSTDWYTRYEGNPNGYLMLITVHEIAHQWWYDWVGNDQANAPWLDEALATYSEFLYVERHYPELTDWWWMFRVNRLQPQGYVDSTVYEFSQLRPYINAVYLRGVLMLHDLRIVLGDEAFYAWLTAYADQYAGEVATPDDLWALLTPEQLNATAVTRTAFMRQPGMGG